MRVPKAPPPADIIFNEAAIQGVEKVRSLVSSYKLVDGQGRYLHWDELRFRPPPERLSNQEWWAAMRMARNAAAQSLPLSDMNGRSFVFCEPATLRASLRHLDMNAGGALGGSAVGLSTAEGKGHLSRSLAEEPFASSFIEGAATTRKIAKKLIYEGRQPRTRDELMVLNNYRAMEFVKQFKDEPLSFDLLLELHRLVTQGTLEDNADAGRIRRTDDIQVVDDTSGEILHQPPPAVELEARLQALFSFANVEESPDAWVHPLSKAIILHFMLAYEHPFVDGNGRVARALFYWYALKAGYWLLEYASISSVIAEAKIRYGRAFLFTETDGSDLTYFLMHQVEMLNKALGRLHAYVDSKREEVVALADRLTDRSAFNDRQAWLLNEFIRERMSRTTIADQEARYGVSYLTARSDLEKLAEAGLLRKTKAGRTSIYRPVSNLSERLAHVVDQDLR